MASVRTVTDEKVQRHVVTTGTASETMALGALLAHLLRPGDVVPLWGGFGVGKTTFIQGVCRALGVHQPVVSPSYGLVHEYQGEPGRLVLFHLDLYRLESAGEATGIGIEDILGGDGVALIEWPAVIQQLLPRERLDVHMDLVPGGARSVGLVATGGRYIDLLAAYAQAMDK